MCAGRGERGSPTGLGQPPEPLSGENNGSSEKTAASVSKCQLSLLSPLLRGLKGFGVASDVTGGALETLNTSTV